MEPKTKEATEITNRRITNMIRDAVHLASDRYELLTGKVVTRAEVYRQGADWIVEMEVTDLPATMREDKFG